MSHMMLHLGFCRVQQVHFKTSLLADTVEYNLLPHSQLYESMMENVFLFTPSLTYATMKNYTNLKPAKHTT